MHNLNQHSFGRALYYPYVRVQDVNWLKAALLYWDEISCIVPENYHPGNPEGLKAAEEFILPLDPKPYIKQAESIFRERVLTLATRRDCPEARTMLSAVAQALGENSVWIHANKMTGEFRKEFEEIDILQRDADDRMFLAGGLDALYMICLANEMGLATHRPPLTDTKEYAECQRLFHFQDNAETAWAGDLDQKKASMLVKLRVAMPSPRQLINVPLDSIVGHHRKRAAERRAFRQAIEEVIAKASDIADPIALADYLADRRRDIEQRVSDHRKTLDDLKVGAVESALQLSSPRLGHLSRNLGLRLRRASGSDSGGTWFGRQHCCLVGQSAPGPAAGSGRMSLALLDGYPS